MSHLIKRTNSGAYPIVCQNCGKIVYLSSYFALKRKQRYCSVKCRATGSGNVMYGKHHTLHTKKLIAQKVSEWLKREGHPLQGCKRPDVTRRNIINNPTKSPDVIRKISITSTGRPQRIKGKTWEEFYGEARAKKMKRYESVHNPSKLLEVRAKISKSNKEFLMKHPERHPNYLLRRNRKTKCESNLQDIIESVHLKEGKDFVYNCYLNTGNTYRFPDFRFTKKKLIIEANGYFMHFTPEGKALDTQRNKEFTRLGYKVLSFNSYQIRKRKEYVKECILKALSQ